jgi:hypothetical protein
VFTFASKKFFKKGNLVMKKRDLVVKFENLPARAVQLTDDAIVNVFGGCKKEGACCDLCACCDEYKCTETHNSSGTTHYCEKK